MLLGGTSIVGAVDAEDTLTSNFTLISTAASSPEISHLSHFPPGYTTTEIGWAVNFSCNNRVFYGYNLSSGNGTWSNWDNGTASPRITLIPLYPGTTYEYQAWSYNPTDSSFNDSDPVGAPFSNFTTLTPTVPNITSLTNTEPTTSTVYVTWSTNQSDSNNRVKYGKLSDLSDGVWSGWYNNTNSASIQLTNLDKNTTYYYQAWCHNLYSHNLSDSEPDSEPYKSFLTATEQTTKEKFIGTTGVVISLLGVLAIVSIASMILFLLYSVHSGAEIDWKLILVGAVSLIAFLVVMFVGISVLSVFT